MKNKFEFKKMGLIVVICLIVLTVIFILKETYSINDTEMILESSNVGEIDILCDSSAILPSETLSCSVKAVNFDMEVSSFSAKINLDNNLEILNIEKDSGWEGSVEGGIIDLYTDVNKKENFDLFTFTVKASDINNGIDTVSSLKNVVISDQDFVEHTFSDVNMSIRIKSTVDTLQNLSVENVEFNFEPKVLSYNLTTDLEEIIITVDATSKTATVSGDVGLKKLNFGVNTFTIIVVSEAGTQRIYNLTINRPEKLSFNEGVIVDDNNMILQFNNSNLKLVDILKKINTTGIINCTNNSGNNIGDNDYIGTGYKLDIQLSTKKYNYTIVILGDTTGDGQLTVADVSKIFQHYRGTYEMEDIYVLAGDVQTDAEIKLTDVAKLFQYVRGNIESLN